MLAYLEIKNFILIDHVKLDLINGLNIISGESGSGKSLFLKALKAILGEKNNLEWIKPGKDSCEISAVFHKPNKKLVKLLKELDIPIDSELNIRRIISATSNSKIFINDTIVSITKLQEIGEYLGDFVSQHQNQKLIKNKYQLEIVDSFYKDSTFFLKLGELLSSKKKIVEEKNALLDRAKFKEQNVSFLESKIREIQNAKLKLEDFESIKQLDTIKENIKNKQQYQELHDLFYKDQGICSLITKVRKKTSGMNIPKEEKEKIEASETLVTELADFFHSLLDNTDEITMDEERINLIKKIQNKYGQEYNEVKDKLNQFKQEINQLNNLDEELKLLEENIQVIDKEAIKLSEKISETRKENALKLQKQISQNLQSLEMKGSSFEIMFEKVAMTASGFDKVQFSLSSNKGQKNRPINEIASGGELSRLTLAIYLSLANFDQSFLVFDEIDAGIGGTTAFSIGAKLKDLSTKQQVLCITHLAQIAAYNDQIIKVTKDQNKQDTITQIVNIQAKDQILLEISRMLGDSQNKGLQLAEELVNKVKS